jgi:hypothetical protein
MIDVDDVRLRHLNVWAVATLVAVVGLFGYAILGFAIAAVHPGFSAPDAGAAIGALVVAGLLLLFVNEFVTAHTDAYCDECGEPIRSNDVEDEITNHLVRHVSGTPQRISVFGQSFVLRTRHYDVYYCSADCAVADSLDHEAIAAGDSETASEPSTRDVPVDPLEYDAEEVSD